MPASSQIGSLTTLYVGPSHTTDKGGPTPLDIESATRNARHYAKAGLTRRFDLPRDARDIFCENHRKPANHKFMLDVAAKMLGV